MVVLPGDTGTDLCETQFEVISHASIGKRTTRYVTSPYLNVVSSTDGMDRVDGIVTSKDVITIGPACAGRKSTKRDLTCMLAKAKINNARVELSKVPYVGS